MSFNEGVRSDSGRVSSSRGGRTGRGVALGGGGSIIALIAVFLLSQYTGIDLTGLLGQGGSFSESTTTTPGIDLSACTTGRAANERTECRMVTTADSLDIVWTTQMAGQAPQTHYRAPGFTLFENAVSTGCGNATSATGPFYCPTDASVYLDLNFFAQMERDFGAENAPLAQEYVVAHEWGHHIQNLMGTFGIHDAHQAGADGEGVRMELQADCYAGIWMHWASRTIDPDSGVTFLKQPTRAQIDDALKTAASIGDDRIQERYQGRATPDTWTHGAAEQRARWLMTGLETGSVAACDTFSAEKL
ncbi:neutral zinc metallopeptidase [Schaalia sp. 19OD2882]|uniref:KPN_02809 family neutral zinc metallopeptidase n=1 Tax=Schaalia sp. 19OD2882 TaxID=2794089 RepID=UPI001C1EF3F6|nr:neutral zinc metallopeptidase [Schaalia sp. 19OD2882]QWW18750.1 neutral zinc metallopeptidase [Schaalia sp. 19OD2882]